MKNRAFIKEKRQIRVFISSSFEDMDDERNYLIDEIFPRIQEKARKRAVAVTALDLRWGIPDGTDLGQTIEICMNEIDNSFPFFIGIVGGRYGTQPDKAEVFDSNEILREQFSILRKYFEKRLSITEMEMRYGVLDCDEEERRKINALFLTRKDDLGAIKKDVRLNALNNDIHACGEQFDEGKISRDEKNHIWTSDYSSVEEFGRIVELVFEDILDRLFPEDKNLDIFQRQQFMQESVLADLSRFYVPNVTTIKAISGFIDDPLKQKLLITGESGCGKSSLLAYWISKYATDYKEKGVDLIYHFVGSESDSRVIEQRILHKMIADLNVKKTKDDEDGKKWAEEKKSLNRLLSRTIIRENDNRSIVIIIDAVNQLETGYDIDTVNQREARHDLLHWLRLNAPLPHDVKLIISTLKEDETEKTIRKSNPDQVITVSGLVKESDRQNAIELYIKDFHGRNLGDNNLGKVVRWPLSQNPLALKTLLNELIVAGRYDQMDSLVDRYINCQSIEALFDRILVRISNNPNFAWVEDAMGAIALSRYGLSEDEILRIIPIHILHWSSFYCSFQRHFFVRNGLITFAHQYVRKAVERAFLASDDKQTAIHSLLIPLFKDGKTARDQEELMHHFFALEDYPAVYDLYSRPDVFCHLWENDLQNLESYWERLIHEGYSPECLILTKERFDEQELANELEGGYSKYCENLQRLLSHLHLHGLSLKLFQTLEKHTEEEGTFGSQHMRMYRIIAKSYEDIGELEKAIELYKRSFWTIVSFNPESDTSAFKAGFDENDPDLDPLNASAYLSISSSYRRLGKYDESRIYLDYAKKCVQSDSEPDSSHAEYVSYLLEEFRYNRDLGNYDEAKAVIGRTLGKAASYQDFAERVYHYGDYPKAISIWHDYIKLIKGDAATITGVKASIAYREIAANLIKLKKILIAEQFIEASFKCIGGRKDTDYLRARNYKLLARIYYFRKDYNASLEFYLRAEGILERMQLWPEWVEICQETANVSAWANKTRLGVEFLQKALNIIEHEKRCTDFQKGQLLWTISGLEIVLGFYEKCFEHAHIAFDKIIYKLGPQNEKSSKIIQRLDTCISKESSLKKQLAVPSSSMAFSEWDRYVLLTNESELTPLLKAHLVCNKIISDPKLWEIILQLSKSYEQKTIIKILESDSVDKFLDKTLSCIERDYDKEFLERVFMAIIFSPDGAEESRVSSLSNTSLQGTWASLQQRHGALFAIQDKKVRLSIDILKDVIISHYFKYEDNGVESLVRFVEEMSRECPNTLFSHIDGKQYYRQLRQDADFIKKYLARTNGIRPQDIDPVLTNEAIKIVSKYLSSRDDISMILTERLFYTQLSNNGVENDVTLKAAGDLQKCINFDSLPGLTKGYVNLVLGVKAFNEKNYSPALAFLHKYYTLAYQNDPFFIRMRCYKIVNECFEQVDSGEWDTVIPQEFSNEWLWEKNRYKFLNNSLLHYFLVTDEKVDKDNNLISIRLNENTGCIFTNNASHKFRFIRYGTETKIELKGKVHVVLLLQRAVWHDLDDDCEVMNLYQIKYPDGVKLRDFNTYINAVLKSYIRIMTHNVIEPS